MEIFIQKDPDERKHIEEDGSKAELIKELEKNQRVLEEKTMGNLTLWAPENVEKPRELSPQEKIARDRYDAILTQKAEIKDTKCWMHTLGCTHKPIAWVREIQFDMKNDKANINHSQVSTGDYEGPIPGFCMTHIASAPAQLAQTVYFSRQEMQWGLKPKRWFAIFTDGSKQGGNCLELDPEQQSPTITEEFIKNKEN